MKCPSCTKEITEVYQYYTMCQAIKIDANGKGVDFIGLPEEATEGHAHWDCICGGALGEGYISGFDNNFEKQ